MSMLLRDELELGFGHGCPKLWLQLVGKETSQ